MKLFKGTVSLMVALSMLLSVFDFPAFSAYSEDTSVGKAPVWIFSDDFNSYGMGQMPPTSIISAYSAKSNYLGIEPIPDNRDRSICVRVKSTTDTYVHTKKIEPGLVGKFIFELDVRIDKPSGCNKSFVVYQTTADGTTGTQWTLFTIDGNNRLSVCGNDSGYTVPEGKFTTISLAIDTVDRKVSLYVNYKLRASGLTLPDNAENMSYVRLHVANVNEGCETEVYIDNLKIYESTEALNPEQIAAIDWNIDGDVTTGQMEVYMANKLGFYVDSSNYYVDGKISKMDGIGDVTAIERNDMTYIPAKYGAEAFGGKIAWDSKTAVTTLSVNDNDVKIDTMTGKVIVNGEERENTNDTFVEAGRTYVSSNLFSELSGKKLFEDTGIILFSDIEIDYNWYDDESVLKELISQMCFNRPDGETIEANLRAKWQVGEHPRMLADKKTFERIKQEVATSEIKKAWFEDIKDYTENAVMKYDLLDYGTTDGIRMRDHCGRIKEVIYWTGFMWQMTGDEKYPELAWVWLEKMGIGSYPDWNHTRHWLDTGTFLVAYGMAYDWFYDWMNEDQRKLVRDTIVKFGFEEYLKSTWYQNPGTDNWNSVIAAGNIISAIAIMDEEPEISKTVIKDAVRSMEGTLLALAPDGACYEGPDYWGLVIESLVEGIWALQAVSDNGYGLVNSPGFAEAGYFPYALAGKVTLNYGNAGEKLISTVDGKDLFYLASINNDENLRNFRYKLMIDENIRPNFREIIACVGDPSTETDPLSLDKYYRVVETAAIRSSWDTNTMLFGGLHAGQTTINNGQLDTGTFYIDSFGDRFACDYGSDSYNLSGVKFRHRGEGHNIMIFNPDDRVDDIDPDGYAKIERFETNEVSAIMSTDLTCNYPDFVESAVRGMRFVNGRTSIVVQDDVKSEKENEVYWFMQTKADVTISDDGKTAILDIGGNRLEAKLLSDVGKFEVGAPAPLPTSPQTVGQNKNEGYSKLFIHLEDVKDFTISVCFTPLVYTPVGGEIKYPEVTPIDEWVLENPDEVTVGVLPKLSSIKVDGKELLGFSSDKNFYNYALKPTDTEVLKIEAEGDGEVSVIYPDNWPGSVEIKINNGHFENVYGIRFNSPPASLADQGYTELDISEITASDVPQKENPPASAFDNDFETRYSVPHPGWICLDLGEAKLVYYVSLAFYLGDTRMNEFTIEVSEDGSAWTKVYQGRDSGTSLELQNFDIKGVSARYIRITGTGIVNHGSDSASQGWFSPTEIKCYTK